MRRRGVWRREKREGPRVKAARRGHEHGNRGEARTPRRRYLHEEGAVIARLKAEENSPTEKTSGAGGRLPEGRRRGLVCELR